jgi:hypothetical protein
LHWHTRRALEGTASTTTTTTTTDCFFGRLELWFDQRCRSFWYYYYFSWGCMYGKGAASCILGCLGALIYIRDCHDAFRSAELFGSRLVDFRGMTCTTDRQVIIFRNSHVTSQSTVHARMYATARFYAQIPKVNGRLASVTEGSRALRRSV